jgi:serine/threonine protein kinase
VSSAKQGDLQLAIELEGSLEELQAIHVTKQVLDAVAFLHDNKIVHLDIKVRTTCNTCMTAIGVAFFLLLLRFSLKIFFSWKNGRVHKSNYAILVFHVY